MILLISVFQDWFLCVCLSCCFLFLGRLYPTVFWETSILMFAVCSYLQNVVCIGPSRDRYLKFVQRRLLYRMLRPVVNNFVDIITKRPSSCHSQAVNRLRKSLSLNCASLTPSPLPRHATASPIIDSAQPVLSTRSPTTSPFITESILEITLHTVSRVHALL